MRLTRMHYIHMFEIVIEQINFITSLRMLPVRKRATKYPTTKF